MALKAGYKGIKNNLLNKLKVMPFISEIGDGLTLENGELSATGGGGGADLSVIAPAFSAETAYTAGEYVTYESKLYKFTTDHAAGAWDVSDVTEVTVTDDLEKTYKIDNATESAIVDADYIPFLDSSASTPRKSTWSNFCSKISAKFATVFNAYLGVTSIGSGLVVNDGVLSATSAGIDYSSAEVDTGLKWFNKTLYRKSFLIDVSDITFSSGATNYEIADLSSLNIDDIFIDDTMSRVRTNSIEVPVSCYRDGSNYYFINYTPMDGKLNLFNSGQQSYPAQAAAANIDIELTIYYTKQSNA